MNPLDLKTPAQADAAELASEYGLANHGLTNLRCVYWNLPVPALYEEIAFRAEGRVARHGPMVVNTGRHSGRAAQDKFIVREPSSEDDVWWGEYNRPIAPETFETILGRMLGFLQGRDVFVQDCEAAAQPEYRLPIRVVTELAWHSLFARNMFHSPGTREAHRSHVPEFTIICAPSFRAYEPIDGTRTRDVRRAELREAALPHRRHGVRGRDQEVRLHAPQLPAAARGRAEHALLRERRRGRRRRALLRALGHRQDDALRRPAARPRRRRRARLERRRRLQPRERLLREGDPPLAVVGAADPSRRRGASGPCSRTSSATR